MRLEINIKESLSDPLTIVLGLKDGSTELRNGYLTFQTLVTKLLDLLIMIILGLNEGSIELHNIYFEL